ncbi:conserved hypothetical protein [Vibrio nigripulchritudo SOn1]|uniref:AB hydrolase-1 domain-containing protein n=1 Tax=Vibrio nigripulchritudo SOn1 TaxID=1238450 RepID=A0AAV2VPK6_9VIBR|nr:alpha/beta hydrolase [Vibrio nigripulchritudo]CCO46650.1 conserved hypothetical protein [Vibrio nigripulchritudo SOn1]
MNIQRVNINGNDFRYSLIENNDTEEYVIFLLGALQDIESVKKYSQHFSKTINCITVEVSGTGNTNVLNSKISVRDQAYMLLDLVHHLNITSAHIVGFSYATAVAIELHDIWSSVKSISVCGGVPGIPDSGRIATKQMIAASIQSKEAFSQSFVESLTVNNSEIPRNKATIRATKIAISEMDQKKIDMFFENSVRLLVHTPSNLNKIRIPVLVCVAEYDPYCTIEMARDFSSQMKNSRLFVIKNADHLAHMQQPEQISSALITLASSSVMAERTLNNLS